ncbi:MAG TPA: phosphatidate cytidylyltransferase [Acidimicrobiales bacterium]|nr:phosphatidate cytidylyltransferase [Acidimicrobiales bacterium]
MQDDDPQGKGEVSNQTAPTLRINLPTAGSVASGEQESSVPGGSSVVRDGDDSTVALEHLREPMKTDGLLDTDEFGARRIVGRSFAERVADYTRSAEQGSEGGEPKTSTFILPDWADPPTGLVPRVLLDEDSVDPGESELVEVARRGPSWRDEDSGWGEDAGLSFLADDDEEDDAPVIAGTTETTSRSYDFGFDEVDFDFGSPRLEAAAKWDEAFGDREDPADLISVVGPNAAQGDELVEDVEPPHRRRLPRRRALGAKENPEKERSVVVATVVGVLLGAIALLCFHYGPRTTLLLVAFAVTVAAAELFSSLQQVGYRPATLVGIIAVPLMVFGTYLHGAIAIPLVIALLMLSFAVWGIAGLIPKDPLLNLGVTSLVVIWTGILGSFAGLLLNPNSFPSRHGVAYIVGAVVLTVAHDVGSYVVGARLGRHKIAPRVSPGKTREGLVGGSVLTVIVAFALVAHIHPFTFLSAGLLGVVVLVFAPIGDLFESVAKRDLGIKDMGRILPAHGGIFDRIDAMLFVLPATYLLLRLLGKN